MALDEPLRSATGPFTRDVVTLFLDLAGFTSLSERLALHGTAGSERLGALIREAIGGSLDAVSAHGGDSLAFGGDAITAAFGGPAAWDRARRAAEDVIELVGATAGAPTPSGPAELSVRIGISAGRVTSLVCPARRRHVVVHLGRGLDAAVAAQGRAAVNAVVVERVHDLVLGADRIDRVSSLPAWAPRTLHPVNALRVAGGRGPPDEHRRITPVFISSPAVDDRDPAALEAFAGFVTCATDLIDDLGGDVLHCGGGDKGVTLVAVFGTPVAHPDDAARAVHAVQRLRELVAVDFGAGIASGLVFTAAFGGRTRTFFSALGNAMNVAARLMVAAAAGATLVDERTAEAVAGLATFGQSYVPLVKGRSERVAVAEVLALQTAGRRFDSSGDTPLVGRENELAAAEELLDGVSGGVGALLAIVGDAGSGKSRLAAEIARRAGVRGLRIRSSAFEAFGLGRPLAPFAELLRLGLEPMALTNADELGAAVTRALPNHPPLAPLLGPLLDVPVRDSGLTAGLREEERSELARRLVVDLLCATTAPTLIVLEDLHWADELSIDLLGDLASRLSTTMLAVVTTSRARPPVEPARTRTLGDLSPDQLATVVRDTWSGLGGGELPASYVDTLAQRAAGNPLFAETVTELVRRASRPGEPLPAVPLPDQLLPYLGVQLDALGDTAQHTALCLAVLGRPATSAEIARVFGLDVVAVDHDVALLVDAGIARRVEGGRDALVWLRHATVAEALLTRASHAARVPLHERVCRYLITSDASAREIARHLEHGGPPELEGHWYREARREAWTMWALGEARHWAELVAALEDPIEAAVDQVALAELEQLVGEHDRATERLALLSDEPRVAAGVERLLGRIAFENGRPGDAVEHLTRAEAAGEQGASVAWPLTMALCDLGRFDAARERATAQLAAAGRDDRRMRLDALANLGAVVLWQGDLELAAAVLEEARQIAEELGDVMRLAYVTGDLAGVRFLAGDIAEAAALLDVATGLAHRLGARRVVNMTLGNLSHVRLAADDRDGAQRTAAAGAEAALDIGDVATALNFVQLPIIVAELDGARELASSWWQRHSDLEERIGRPEGAAISALRYAVLIAADQIAAARAAIARADAFSTGPSTSDLDTHRQRAIDACAGIQRPPPEAATTAIDLPPLDIALPPVTPASVDALLDQIERRLLAVARARAAPAPDGQGRRRSAGCPGSA